MDVEEKKYLLETGFVTETQSNMGGYGVGRSC